MLAEEKKKKNKPHQCENLQNGEHLLLDSRQQRLLFTRVAYFLEDIRCNQLDDREYYQTGLNQKIPEI